MKRIVSIVIAIVFLFAMASCSQDPFKGYYSISTEAQLKEFLEGSSTEAIKAYLSNDITIVNNGDSQQTDQESIFVVNGNKTIDLNGKSIKATVKLSTTSTNYVVQSWPKITGFALIQVDDGAKITLNNGTVETVFAGEVSNKGVSSIDKYYFETIQNLGEFVAENTTVNCYGDVKTPVEIKSSVSGVFNRNKVKVYTSGSELSKVPCTVTKSVIDVSNKKGEANSIASCSNTETNVTGSTLLANGYDSSKGVFLIGHETGYNTIYHPYETYPISLNMKNSEVSVDGKETKARGVFALTTKERSKESICATLDDVSFTLAATAKTNLIKVEDDKNESTTSVKIVGTSVSLLNKITATAEFIPNDKNKASVNINGIPL